MTNKEAADLLKRMQITLARGTGRVLLAEALELAISALEHEFADSRWTMASVEREGLNERTD